MPSTNLDASSLPQLNLPQADIRLRQDADALRAFDPLRNKWVVLTPEEWVRLNFTSFLRNFLHYPSSLMANEVAISLNNTRRRCDTVVYDPHLSSSGLSPLMIIEYKAPDVTLTQDVFDQIVRYNMTLHARYLVVSNGLNHYCCVIDYNSASYHFIPSIPGFDSLMGATAVN